MEYHGIINYGVHVNLDNRYAENCSLLQEKMLELLLTAVEVFLDGREDL
jgi:hypothetical protein